MSFVNLDTCDSFPWLSGGSWENVGVVVLVNSCARKWLGDSKLQVYGDKGTTSGQDKWIWDSPGSWLGHMMSLESRENVKRGSQLNNV